MRKTIYDKHYKETNYFGSTYPKLVEFFKAYDKNYKVLDLGCGQGRDALFLGRLGYQVKGIDISKVGIRQMNQKAKEENLNVIGEISDIYEYPITDAYDVVLLDSMVHFYKNDITKETNLIKRVATELKVGGILINCMLKGLKREKHLKNILNKLPVHWEVIHDTYTDYPEANSEFHIIILKKIE
ncbi:MAG TPA: class I SAM-dependent methyltransferase [Clostridia bacterium]|nr:class I SAM-dependent methyltransferase [Clostridia bacterium]